ncbi:hypothetical protein CsatA_022821 [Cannabis sativa]
MKSPEVEALEKIEFLKVNWNSITPITDKGSPYANFWMERWIIVSVSDYASDSLRKLVKIKGWQVLTIGNSKTPSDWSLKELPISFSFRGLKNNSLRFQPSEKGSTPLGAGEILYFSGRCSLRFSRRRKGRLHSLLLSGEEGSSVSTINLFSSRVFQTYMSYLLHYFRLLQENIWNVAKKAFDPISILLSLLVAKGLISASKTELPAVIPPEVPPQTQKKSQTVTSIGSVPLSSVSASLFFQLISLKT